LLDLCGLPAYDRNEGIDLVPAMTGDAENLQDYTAITAFGMNNHGLRTSGYRYIRYEDGGEELYDRNADPNEWTNLAGNPEYEEIKQELKEQLPEVNRQWAVHSSYTFQPYFVEQKERTSQ
jgi:hypothetical protein